MDQQFEDIWFDAYLNARDRMRDKIASDVQKLNQFAKSKGFKVQDWNNQGIADRVLKEAEFQFVLDLGIRNGCYSPVTNWAGKSPYLKQNKQTLLRLEQNGIAKVEADWIWMRYYKEYWKYFRVTVISSILVMEHLANKNNMHKDRIEFSICDDFYAHNVVFCWWSSNCPTLGDEPSILFLDVYLFPKDGLFDQAAYSNDCYFRDLCLFTLNEVSSEYIRDVKIEANGLSREVNEKIMKFCDTYVKNWKRSAFRA